MKKFTLSSALPLAIMWLFFAVTATGAMDIQWSGLNGNALLPPVIAPVTGADNQSGVTATVAENGDWQGMCGTLAAVPDLSQYGGIEFYVRQSFYSGNPACVIRFNLQNESRHIYRYFNCGNGGWNHVIIPFDPDGWTSSGDFKVEFGPVTKLVFYPFSNLNRKGQKLEICGIKLLPKSIANSKITIQGYTYGNPPTEGDSRGEILNDGRTDISAVWPAYTSDPEILFDLGGTYVINAIKIEAMAAPSHNFSTLALAASIDNKNYRAAGIIRNEQSGSAKKLTTFSMSQGDIIARYLKVSATRPRPDFPITLSEFSFYGHPADRREIAAAVAARYYIGPEMASRDSSEYCRLKNNDLEIRINRRNGVINGISYRNNDLVERLYPVYTVQTRDADGSFDGYGDKVTALQEERNAVTLRLVNPKLPGLEIEREYRVEDGSLRIRTTVISQAAGEKRFLRLGTAVVLNRQFRRDGVYETWGAGHTMSRLFAADVLQDIPACNVPTLSFENRNSNLTLFHYRDGFNGKFLYLDPVSEEARTTLFRDNGWLLGEATVTIGATGQQRVSSALDFVQGSLLTAYDRYLRRSDVAAYRAAIRRPAWLRDACVVSDTGWEGMWQDAGRRITANFVNNLKFGYVIDPFMQDLNFTWGEAPTGGTIRNLFGGEQSAELLREKVAAIKKLDPRIKLGIYTWLWSAFPYSEPAVKHPEWFVRKLRNGSPASWFPGFNTNWMRFWDIPASRNQAVEMIIRMVNYYNLDIWYLDGGNAGSYAKDWDSMHIDAQDAYGELYREIRDKLQRRNPDAAVFFNVPCNPQGDFGFLESFNGTMTAEWRKGAAWMWKFKLFQYRDQSHYPVYIYWLPGVDGAYQNYMVGTGLLPAFNSKVFTKRDIPFISARYEVRRLELTDATVRPDWRSDAAETLECMALKQGGAGFVFLNPHAMQPQNRKVMVFTDALGISEASLPLFQWVFTVKSGRTWGGEWGENELAEGYRRTGWIADRAVVPTVFAQGRWTATAEREFRLSPGEAKIWTITQTPGFIWSIDGLPRHFRIPGSPGIQLSGRLPELMLDSEYKEAEIAVLVPEGMLPNRVTVDGKETTLKLIRDTDTLMAVIPVSGQGTHRIVCRMEPARIPQDNPELDVKLRGNVLEVTADCGHTWQGLPLLAAVRNSGELNWGGSLPAGKNKKFQITLGNVVRDGDYEVTIADPSGQRSASRKIRLAGYAKSDALLPALPNSREKVSVRDENQVVNGIRVRQSAVEFDPANGTADADAKTLSLKVGELPMYQTYYNNVASGFSLKFKRFVKIRLSGNFKDYNIHGQMNKVHFIRHDNPDCFAGLFFDFERASGRMQRVAASLGKVNPARMSPVPRFGAACKPEAFYELSDFIRDDKNDSVSGWVDLSELNTPSDWTGNTWVSVVLQLACPNRMLRVDILETDDQLPAKAVLFKPVSLTRKVDSKEFHATRLSGKINIDGKDNDASWKRIPAITDFSALSSPATPPIGKMAVRIGHDGKFLYLYFSCTEQPGRRPDCSRGQSGQPYLGDSIEFYIQNAEVREQILHCVIDAEKNHLCEISELRRRPGATNKVLSECPFRYATRVYDGGWDIEAAIPFSALGLKPEQQTSLGFNLMRNRLNNGLLECFTLVPGNTYFPGDVYKLTIK